MGGELFKQRGYLKVGLFLHKKRINFVWDVLCFTFGLLNIYRVVTTFTAPYFITINLISTLVGDELSVNVRVGYDHM